MAEHDKAKDTRGRSAPQADPEDSQETQEPGWSNAKASRLEEGVDPASGVKVKQETPAKSDKDK